MKCAKRGCKNDALNLSNYCGEHRPYSINLTTIAKQCRSPLSGRGKKKVTKTVKKKIAKKALKKAR